MAKVTGPLMSMDASGGFGGALVFGKWKGRNTVHQLVTPSNPHSADQEAARNMVRVGGAAQHHVNVDATVKAGKTGTDKVRISAITPNGFAWNGFLVDSMIGKGGLTYADIVTAYAALTAPNRTAWDDAAVALTPAYANVYQTAAGGGATTPQTPGFAFFATQYALYIMGLDTVPGAVPPTYA